VRPPGLTGDPAAVCTDVGVEGEVAIYDPAGDGQQRRVFNFDRVFDSGATQHEVYEDTQPLIRSVLDGRPPAAVAWWRWRCRLAASAWPHWALLPPWRSHPGAGPAPASALAASTTSPGARAAQLTRRPRRPRRPCSPAGFNVCIFAYGQTGSGKTHTMAGTDVQYEHGRGINYRALDDLFRLRESREGEVRAGLLHHARCLALGLAPAAKAPGPLEP
jgi:hypothetical protein